MERTNHYILNYLDEPTRIIFFTPTEIVTMCFCFFGGVFMDRFVAGVVLAFISVWALRKIRSQFKITSARQLLYWFFPFSEKPLQCPIPSHIRELYP